MLCINLTSVRDNKPIYLTNKLTASRVYIGPSDVPSFPNRLVFTLTEEAKALLLIELRELGVEWLDVELEAMTGRAVFLTVPFALRVQEEAYTNFRERNSQREDNALMLNLPEPTIFIHGNNFPIICTACSKQETLHGRRCPDYVEGNYQCFQTSRFALSAMDTFYLNEKGELVYNATSVSAAPAEQVESDATTTDSDAQPQPTSDIG